MIEREAFRAALVASVGEDATVSYFDRSGFKPGALPVLYPWSFVAEDRFRREGRFQGVFKEYGVTLGPVIAEHLKNPPPRGGAGERRYAPR